MAQYVAKVSTDGSGDGTATFPEGIRGYVQDIRIDYGGTPDAGTDVTIAEAAADSLKRTLLAITNSGTPATYAPQQQVCDNAGAAKTWYKPFYIEGKSTITVTVHQAVISTTNAVVVRIQISEE